jgi:hypothetical protein
LAVLFNQAGNVDSIRSLLLKPTVAEQAASTLTTVSQETAGQLLREFPDLPPGEQEATLHQVALLLEIASAADEHAMQRRHFLRSPGITDNKRYMERLLLLGLIYQLIGHHAKAEKRVQRARETLPEIKRLMDWEVEVAARFPCTRTEQYFPLSPYSGMPARQAVRRIRHEETLTGLERACEQVEHLSP